MHVTRLLRSSDIESTAGARSGNEPTSDGVSPDDHRGAQTPSTLRWTEGLHWGPGTRSHPQSFVERVTWENNIADRLAPARRSALAGTDRPRRALR